MKKAYEYQIIRRKKRLKKLYDYYERAITCGTITSRLLASIKQLEEEINSLQKLRDSYKKLEL